ncbi:MAG TPA: NADP-dependent oxidoreductase [Verrucomicrobiae bacterium]|nr:NADP-dependent oxidoreductase [Verrucomicrobiae bacterium]
MKAMRVHLRNGAQTFVMENVRDPVPTQGQVLVRVHATAVMPTELRWPTTWRTFDGQPRPSPILGHEFSGVVAAVGSGVTGVREGEAVYGLNGWDQDGAEAEYVLVSSTGLAPKPRSISHAEAAVVPISALTAWQALVDRAHIVKGQRVLIHGGAGGVGSFAIQIARNHGAHVITTISARNANFVRELGADEVIDYKTTRFERVTGDLDVVLDIAGGETLELSKRLLKPEGRLLTVATDSSKSEYFFYVEPNRVELVEIARLIDSGKLRPIVDDVVPLERAAEAYQRNPGRGKIALQVT